jgi:hypothetical protein
MPTPKTPAKKTPAKKPVPKKTKSETPPKPRAPRTKRLVEADVRAQKSLLDRSVKQSVLALRLKVKMFYDLQSMRIIAAGRTAPKAEDGAVQLHEADKFILTLRAQELDKAEKNALRDVSDHLESISVYVDVFSDKTKYRGIGPTLWGVILSEFDVERDTVSKWWSFAGLVPVPARRCGTCHRIVESSDPGGFVHKVAQRRFAKPDPSGATPKPVEIKCPHKLLSEHQTYASGHSARPVRGEKNKYNAWLRTKLCGVLAPCLIKLGSPWRKFYDDYKHRLQSKHGGWGTSDAHRHAAAMRYMVKMLLVDIHSSWRHHEGLPVRPPYSEEYLGKKHSGGSGARVQAPREPDGTGDTFLDRQIAEELALHDQP